MNTLMRYAVEVVAALWLVIVAVQFLSRYFIPGLDVDLSIAYFLMLCLAAVVLGVEALRAVSAYLERDR